MCFSAAGEIMEDNTDYLVLGVVWVVGGSVRCTTGWIPKIHLKLLVQVFPEPGRGTIVTRSVSICIGVRIGAMKFVTNFVNTSLASEYRVCRGGSHCLRCCFAKYTSGMRHNTTRYPLSVQKSIFQNREQPTDHTSEIWWTCLTESRDGGR